jgi:glutaconate CoA-transferase, subunit A
MTDKVMSLREAVERFVPDGASVLMGAGLESLIPFAAGHEIIRQGRRDLTLVGPISDILFDQLIGAGCARRIVAAWVGNVSAGLGHNHRRAAEQGIPRQVEIHDHSNMSLALALQGGAMGVPFIPTKTLLGTDLLKTNPAFREWVAPWQAERLVLVPALQPDVAILQVQRADAGGAAHCWGNLGLSVEAAMASRSLVLVAEEIVSPEVIRSDPNRVLVAPFKVHAVVHEPYGAHPSPVQGYYNRDHAFYHEYHAETRTAEGFAAWCKTWVLDLPDRATYLGTLGSDRVAGLAIARHRWAAPVDYGY